MCILISIKYYNTIFIILNKKRLTDVSPTWQRVIFTRAGLAIVTAKVLNFCVRDGNRCDHFAIATRFEVDPSKPDNRSFWSFLLWLSPRPISISQLHTLLRFHLWPINLIVFQGSYYLRMGNLILESVSCLDAFSAYPFPSWLPSYAPGGTTGAPAEGPSRSSRTKDRSPQISYAHNR